MKSLLSANRLVLSSILTAGLLSAQDVPPTGSHVNREVERERKIDARVDGAKDPQGVLAALREGWVDPPVSCRPHIYWWWPGNAVTKEGISFELGELKAKGFGGANIITFFRMYDKGNVEFASPEYFSLVKYAVDKARELGLEISVKYEPGWNLGNPWVAPDDRTKSMAITEQEVPGGDLKDLALLPPRPQKKESQGQRMRLDAVAAVKLNTDGTPDCTQRVDLDAGVAGDRDRAPEPDLHVSGHLPDGRWKLMEFWTVFTGQHPTCAPMNPPSFVVDYLDKGAVQRAVEAVGERYKATIGQDFGQTVDSFQGDSPELLEDFSLWSSGLFERFRKEKGYDLRPYLPMLKYDGAPETSYVRQDFGSFLSDVGMDSFIDTITDYAESNGLNMQQQPHYRFTTELIQASGRLHPAETEFTRRSFDPNAYPHKVTVSGAQFYPSKTRNWTAAEAFTFITDKYRLSLEQIKQASDLFVRDGISQLYDNGYAYDPERKLSPSRDFFFWGQPAGHLNTWWPYYRGLADYQGRTCFINRLGRSAAQVLLYSPMPSIWSEQATFHEGRFFEGGGVRGVPFGAVPKLLVASGYDFDCVNDDLLQHAAKVQDGKIIINGYSYAALVLPRALCLAPETLRVLDQFVRSGGTLFALNTLPTKSVTLLNHEANDQETGRIVNDLFAVQGGARQVGKGMTWFLPGCDGFKYAFSPNAVDWSPTEAPSPAYAEFIKALHSRLQPDFEIAGTPLSNGLTFRHTTIGPLDVWFICNLEPIAVKTPVTLKTAGKFAQIWDPLTAAIHSLPDAKATQDGRLTIPVDLPPWGSCFVMSTGTADPSLSPQVEMAADTTVPVEGPWALVFRGQGGSPSPLTINGLTDWRSLAGLRDFSGSATYATEFDIPVALTAPGKTVRLDLGEVHEVARVRINGKEAGVIWTEPYSVDVTGLLHAGKNRLEVDVANLPWNYAAGLTAPTPVPSELVEHYGASPNAKPGWEVLQKLKAKHQNDRLPSGLIGPVKIIGQHPVSS